MAQKYISVDRDTKTSLDPVKLVSNENEFHGKLMSTPKNGIGEASDVRDLFISEITVDDEPQSCSQKTDGTKVVNIALPAAGVRAFKATWQNTAPTSWEI